MRRRHRVHGSAAKPSVIRTFAFLQRLLAHFWALAVILLAGVGLQPRPGQGSEVVGALSQNRVALTANFSGTEILIFGAIRHDRPRVEATPAFDLIVVVEGPRLPVTVWRKARIFGIWVNRDAALLPAAPSFYAVATTAPLDQILDPDEDARFRISPAFAMRSDQLVTAVADPAPFVEAYLRLSARTEAFQTLERAVTIDRDILFRTRVRLPANLVEGAYMTRIFLVREGMVVDQFRTAVLVRKAGLERWLSELAYAQPWAYGLAAVALALFVGWLASFAPILLRR